MFSITLFFLLSVFIFIALVPIYFFYFYSIRYGDRTQPFISLTIDDGPCPDSTPIILDLLKQYQIPVTFFCVGEKMQANPLLVARILQEGHEIANHTYSHPYALACKKESFVAVEILKTQTVMSALSVPMLPLFRPVAGVISPPVFRAARAQGLKIVNWTARAYDGGKKLLHSTERMLHFLRAGLVPGGILLLHDNQHLVLLHVIEKLHCESRQKKLSWVLLSHLLKAHT